MFPMMPVMELHSSCVRKQRRMEAGRRVDSQDGRLGRTIGQSSVEQDGDNGRRRHRGVHLSRYRAAPSERAFINIIINVAQVH